MHLYWIRRDFRVRDNPALYHACQTGKAVMAVYLLCESAWRRHDVGANQVHWILMHLDMMRESLASLNIPLKIVKIDRFNQSGEALLKLCESHKVQSVFWNDQYEVDERDRDKHCESLLHRNDVSVERYHDQAILMPGIIQTKQDRCYTVFTPFKKACYAHWSHHGVPNVLPRPKKQSPHAIASSRVPTSLNDFVPSIEIGWRPGEDAALTKLRSFCEKRACDYKQARDFPSQDGVSALSPYLAIGVLSPRQCMARLLATFDCTPGRLPIGARTWLDELLWRDFYKSILYFFPEVCRGQPYHAAYRRMKWSNDKKHWEAWKAGRTGVPLVDAAMRQLLQTGWMHNRLRMVVAMFLSKNLDVDWRWGERFFANHLLDYDFSANNGGWQWSASTGTDAAPYFRIMNPYAQSERFDPDGDFIRQYLPELAHLKGRAIHCPSEAEALDYPAPIVDVKASRQKAIEKFKKYVVRRKYI